MPSFLSSLELQHLRTVSEEGVGFYITKRIHKVILFSGHRAGLRFLGPPGWMRPREAIPADELSTRGKGINSGLRQLTTGGASPSSASPNSAAVGACVEIKLCQSLTDPHQPTLYI